MHNANRPQLSELPTTGQLLRSTAIAAGVAGVLLVAVVLPAEYGIDPTRIGSVFGLTEMGRIKQQLAREAEALEVQPSSSAAAIGPAGAPAAPAPAAAPSPAASAARSDATVITLAPDQAAEIKLVMKEGAVVQFTWTSSGGKVNYDTHADRPGVNYHGYDKGSAERLEGQLTAAFDGSHGWFWRNRTGAPVTITLKTSGDYSEVKRVV